jgi:hypothetical protein
MYTMILIVHLYSKSISVTTVRFATESNCLSAISKSLEMEKSGGIQIKARCVKE